MAVPGRRKCTYLAVSILLQNFGEGIEIMERFSLSFPNAKISNVLLDKIRGSGAFHRFKDTIYRYGIEKDWFKYRDEAYKEIAISWLESHGFAYVDDMNRREQNI